MTRNIFRSPAAGAATVLTAWAVLWFSVLIALAPAALGL
jgi:hypothetical protein